MSQYDGSFEKFADKGGKLFAILLGSLVVLCIGPLLAIPRTGATTFEVAVKPFFPNMNPYIPIIGFFALTYYFSMKQSSVIDIIGRVLTPGLLGLLIFIIIAGIVNPISTPLDPNVAKSSAFSSCFVEGYQTMDALAAVIFAGIIVQSIRAKGYGRTSSIKMTAISGLIAAAGLLVVYGGLMYLGATVSFMSSDIQGRLCLLPLCRDRRGCRLSRFGIAVALACLTTAVGLTAATGEFFSNLSKNRVTYLQVVTLSTIFSALLRGSASME